MKESHDTASRNEITTSAGRTYVDEVVGRGEVAVAGKTATVHFTGWLENLKGLDSSLDRGQPFSFHLGVGQVVKGRDEGVEFVKVAAKRILTIPAHLGYGACGAGGLIPAHVRLTFHIELLDL